ncbi:MULTISPECIES: ABC transporter ATP-binding protein [unclassified Candidatus Frackibacter]|uniref:ABC transporter ATP-binding protein n=1 Tax=unclassified Candidatus Frackibacter TaxID=2648818 RepID=UPI00079A46BF|nr:MULTISPECIES: ABC transporter ATP-binding protein [unclassified Candidatus Frackibacter]KXS45359.1 MAG: ABC-type spermidine/putrescine transport system, ATPase component [Candidatus Frackibacter sp. T328-2]SDC77128.1 iron(III) transport system ATP-binding protein [Candidatus Frackibacter sp. WG11]SEM90277.1 iron(III) transport system ATP-binding protein [Candidatus Frackibacter sp. WG12]SFM00421.1 iron(III) transport system ATP-binding protein [Candidatus Frackibacter sp. WG13]
MLVQIKDLDFRYKNSDEYVLKNFNLDIEKGDIVCILGESGSGKSTVLRLIAGLEVPHKGIIKIDDEVMVNESTFVYPEEREIGVLFQDYALFPHMTVAENILFGVRNKEKGYKEQRLQELLKLIGLEELRERYPHQISGGQQQRVALVRALAIDPWLILMDEPFSNLDANLQSRIRQELKGIIKKTGITSVFVSHDKDDAIDIADKIVVLKDGDIIQQGVTENIVSKPSSKYVAGLFAS